MRFWTPASVPAQYADLCETRHPLFLNEGKWRIVDGTFVAPKAHDLVAQEVLILGAAEIEVMGPVRVVAVEASVVKLLGNGAEAMVRDEAYCELGNGAMAQAFNACHVVARQAAIVFAHDKARIDAHDEALVKIFSRADRPIIRLLDRARIIKSLPRDVARVQRMQMLAAA